MLKARQHDRNIFAGGRSGALKMQLIPTQMLIKFGSYCLDGEGIHSKADILYLKHASSILRQSSTLHVVSS